MEGLKFSIILLILDFRVWQNFSVLGMLDISNILHDLPASQQSNGLYMNSLNLEILHNEHFFCANMNILLILCIHTLFLPRTWSL